MTPAPQLERQHDFDRAACLRAVRLLLNAPAAPLAIPPVNREEADEHRSIPSPSALAA